jgi:hypothetical protein
MKRTMKNLEVLFRDIPLDIKEFTWVGWLFYLVILLITFIMFLFAGVIAFISLIDHVVRTLLYNKKGS